MLPTFVIGLREGLEAALIVGIIAAFLRQQGRRDLVRWVFVGVATAILLCLAVGIALKVISEDLPQKKQEGLETVIGVLAVGMVTYMVVWMRRHSRELKGQLEGLAADAIGEPGDRAARAMVLMAFLAVLREGFETVVFLLAAFNESSNARAAGGGAVLGIAVAVALGYGIYRGGVRLNLSKFFRATGLVLVLVAAGLVVNALHTAHEAGWLNAGQGSTVDLTWLARPGTVRSSLLTGMLGIQPHPVVIEVIGWLVFLIPVGLYVGWPPGKKVPRTVLLRVSAAVGVLGVLAAIALALVAPSRPAANPVTAAGALTAQVVARDADSVTIRTAVASPVTPAAAAGKPVDITLRQTGVGNPGGIASGTYSSTQPSAAVTGRPTELSYAQVAALNGGRLPLGVRPVAGSNVTAKTVAVAYTGSTTLSSSVTVRTGRILALTWVETINVAAVNTPVGTVPLSDPAATATLAFPPNVVASAAAAAQHDGDQIDQRNRMLVGAWFGGIVGVIALLVAAGTAWTGRRPAPPEPEQATTTVQPRVQVG